MPQVLLQQEPHTMYLPQRHYSSFPPQHCLLTLPPWVTPIFCFVSTETWTCVIPNTREYTSAHLSGSWSSPPLTWRKRGETRLCLVSKEILSLKSLAPSELFYIYIKVDDQLMMIKPNFGYLLCNNDLLLQIEYWVIVNFLRVMSQLKLQN